MGRNPEISEFHMDILNVLWERGELSAGEVQEALQGKRDRAISTIATTLARLEKKKLITHRSIGRVFVYRPIVSRREVQRSVVQTMLQRFFGGDPKALVNHLVTESELAPGDLEQAQAWFDASEDEDDA